jgi:hypothetical protein
MAILRTEKIGNDPHFSSCYDILADAVADLAEFPAAGVGSMAYVLATGKVYVKKASEWAEV